MTVYWLLYLIPALGALAYRNTPFRQNVRFWLVCLLLAVAIGWREAVGCDWLAYLWYFDRAAQMNLTSVLSTGDPGYHLMSLLSAKLGWGIYGSNLFCAVIFIVGLGRFCQEQPNPWLALAVAVPYLVIVVSMGYTRQAVALGLIFWSLAVLEKRELRKFLVLVSLATLFHKTAVLMMPLGLFLFGRGWLSRAVAVVCVGLGLWAAFLAEYQEGLWESYIDTAMQSQGATVRIFMNLVPALILIAFWNRWKTLYPQSRIWFWMALMAIACVPLLPYASTAVDRIALYLTPLQVVVLSRAPMLANRRDFATLLLVGIILGYAAVQYVWLNHASHAFCWIPYDNLLL